MPSTYVPSPTATQAPAALPEPDYAGPSVSLPNDGEAVNAAAFAQAYKALADGVAWLFKPRAKSGSNTQPVQTWRNARLQRRAHVDHLGFPGGRFFDHREHWLIQPGVAAPSTPTYLGHTLWLANTLGGVDEMGVSAVIPSTSRPSTRILRLKIKREAYRKIFVWFEKFAFCTNDVAIVMDWEFSADDVSSTGDVEWYMGFCEDINTPGTDAGAYFVRGPNEVNWKVQTFDNGAASTSGRIDTGVLATTALQRFRIELIGANVSDDSTARVVFYINGVQVAAMTTAIPIIDGGGDGYYPTPFFLGYRVNTIGVDTAQYCSIGYVHLLANTSVDAL